MARGALDSGQRLGDQHLCARASSALALAHLNGGQIKEALESYRSTRSARSLVGSNPSSRTNVHRAPISRSKVRANSPASSCRFGDYQFGIFDLLPDSPPCGNGCSRLLLADDEQRRQRDGFEAIPVRAAIALQQPTSPRGFMARIMRRTRQLPALRCARNGVVNPQSSSGRNACGFNAGAEPA
jgi:hypothetical protein